MGGSSSRERKKKDQLEIAQNLPQPIITRPCPETQGSIAPAIPTYVELNRRLAGMSQKAPPPCASPSAKLLMSSRAGRPQRPPRDSLPVNSEEILRKSPKLGTGTSTSSSGILKPLPSCLKKPKNVNSNDTSVPQNSNLPPKDSNEGDETILSGSSNYLIQASLVESDSDSDMEHGATGTSTWPTVQVVDVPLGGSIQELE